MKKYLIICFTVVLLLLGYYYIDYYTSFHFFSKKDVDTFVTIDEKNIKLNDEEFKIRAINMGSSMPGKDDKEYSIDEETYLRWFKQIQEMNVNTIRVFNIESPEFYKALRKYNLSRKTPLYLIQGMDVGDYEKNSSVDYFESSIKSNLLKNLYAMVDVIHGKRVINYNTFYASGRFSYDVSDWTIGYIIGTDWNDVTVEYTNQKNKEDTVYNGKYLKTNDNAKPFERFLAEIGDNVFKYESEKYGEQKLLSFGNAPQTDPFEYDAAISDYFNKFTTVDISRISSTNKVKSGIFAAYQVYSGYPDYYSYEDKTLANSYKDYLAKLNDYYDMPLVISEFGYSTARGKTINTLNDNYGDETYTDEEQGKMIVKAINTMKEVGINNYILYEWHDEWDKNVWNTMYATDTTRAQYWHDLQTSTQNYGILAFDDGKVKQTVTLDGKKNEWKKKDIVLESKDLKLSSKYDTKYLYLLIEKDNLDLDNDTIYIPIDVTSKSGSKKSDFDNLTFTRNADFLIKINGKDNSKVLVQSRYNSLRAVYGKKVYQHDPYEKDNIPAKDSSNFEDIKLITSTQNLIKNNATYNIENVATVVDSGSLVYGDGDPESKDYNSLSDFYSTKNIIEVRIPWGMLNFSDPSLMMVHDDYYKNYGVDSYHINNIYLGVGDGKEKISFGKLELKGWNKKVSYHERLKKSYYIIQDALKGEK